VVEEDRMCECVIEERQKELP